jgi:hypothetical protein
MDKKALIKDLKQIKDKLRVISKSEHISDINQIKILQIQKIIKEVEVSLRLKKNK